MKAISNGRVVNDPLGASRELEKFVDDVGEPQLVAQHVPGETVDVGCAGVDLPFGVEVEVDMPTGRPAVDEFDAGDLDDPMPLFADPVRWFRCLERSARRGPARSCNA